MPPISIAILGVEHYHSNFWTRAFLQAEGVDVAGVFDPDVALAGAFATAHGIQRAGSLAELLARADAVAIASATADHAEFVEAAAAAGLAVLCEKPLATTMADCLRIREAVAGSGIRFMQSFPKRFDPINAELIEVLRSGALGRVTLCRIRHGHSHGLTEDFHKAWYVDPVRSGGGTLLDEGIHAADFLRVLFGDPDTVSAAVSNSALGWAVEDTALATFRYAYGPLCEVATSWCFAAADTSVEIYGTEGTILLGGVDIASRPNRERDFLRVFRRSGGAWSSSPTVPSFKTGVFHEHVAWAFAAALRDDTPMPVGIEDGVRAFAMIDAAYRSAASGRTEAIVYP